jgi:hypothetical protein
MAIRQQDVPKSATRTGLVIRVATRHQLIGESWCSPKLEVTNSFSSSVVITDVELVTSRQTYANHPFRSGAYPVKLTAGQTGTLEVRFELVEPVYKTFRDPAELRVHYSVGGSPQIARVGLVGGALN